MANFILKPTSSNDSIKFQKSDGTTAIDITGTTATLDSGMSFNGTIGASATIADGANPHGWEHIKTISYNADTATPQKMSNVVSSKYSSYRLFVQWGPSSGNQDLFFRFLDTSDTEITTNHYSYGGQIIAENGAEGELFSSTSNSVAQISNDSVPGSRGFNGQITLFNCYASSSDYPQIDGYQLDNLRTNPASPHAFYNYTGHDSGNYDVGAFGFFWYDVDPKYVTGFQLTWASNTAVLKGSWWSCYGLKLPTAD